MNGKELRLSRIWNFMKIKIFSSSEKETKQLGEKFASLLKGGDILLLKGDLGVGKTVFVKGLAKGLKIKKIIQSPSFLLLKIYKIPKDVSKRNRARYFVHFDFYRLKRKKEIEDLGLKEFLKKENIIAIEWPEKIEKILPRSKIVINFYFTSQFNKREIFFKLPPSRKLPLQW